MKTRRSPGWLMNGITIVVLGLSPLAWADTNAPATAASKKPTPVAPPSARPIAGSPVPALLGPPETAAKPDAPDPLSKVTLAAIPFQLSGWLGEVVKLSQAGIDDHVVLSFIDGVQGTFNLGADQIILLRDAGVSSDVLGAMMQHDLELLSGQRTVTASTVPSPTPAVRLMFVPAPEAPPAAKSGSTLASPPLAQTQPTLSSLSKALEQSPGSHVQAIAFNQSDKPVPSLTAQSSSPNSFPAGPPDGSDAPPGWMWGQPDETEGLFTPRPQTASADVQRFPVRKPYAVQLTDPLVFLPGGRRAHNVVVIEMFP